MTRLHLEEEFLPPGGERHPPEPAHLPWPKYPIDEALRQAAGLVERFQRAKAIPAPTSELVELAASAADPIVAVGAPNLTRGLADQLVSGLTDSCRRPLADCLSTVRNLNRVARLLVAHGRISDAAPLIDRAWAMVEQARRRTSPTPPETSTTSRGSTSTSTGRTGPSRSIAARWRSPSERIGPGI